MKGSVYLTYAEVKSGVAMLPNVSYPWISVKLLYAELNEYDDGEFEILHNL